MSAHEGHRQRMRERFLKNGLDTFQDHEILELLLFYCISRKNTNDIAHRLCRRFGSLNKVLEAPVNELSKVEGVGQNTAAFLSMIREVDRRYQINKNAGDTVLNSIEECGNYIVPFFSTERNECVYLLCLDAKCRVICCRRITEGSINMAGISTRKIVEVALAENATSVVLAHNHPGGVAVPSVEDRETTYLTARALAMVDVVLNDHIIVAEDEFISLRRSNLYNPDDVFAQFGR